MAGPAQARPAPDWVIGSVNDARPARVGFGYARMIGDGSVRAGFEVQGQESEGSSGLEVYRNEAGRLKSGQEEALQGPLGCEGETRARARMLASPAQLDSWSGRVRMHPRVAERFD